MTALTARAPSRLRARPQDVVTILLGSWMVAGVFVDGWSHINQPGLESFFTPAHAVLYSGFGATSAWLVGLALLGRQAGTRPWRWLPAGYAPAALGMALFGLGGIGDLVWHSVFGVEVALDALTSPTHLLLFVGGVLLLSSPARRAWIEGTDHGSLRARLPEVASLALVGAVIAFFLMFASPFVHPGAAEPLTTIPEDAPGHYAAEVRAMAALASYLIMSGVVVGVWLFLARRGALPRGSFAVIAATVLLLMASLTSFSRVEGVFGAVVGAVIADALLVALDKVRGVTAPGRLSLAAAIAAASLWIGQLAGLATASAVAWPPELWGGAVMLSAAAGAALGLLATPPATASIGTHPREEGEHRD